MFSAHNLFKLYADNIDIIHAKIIASQWIKEVGACETIKAKLMSSLEQIFRTKEKMCEREMLAHLASFHPTKEVRNAVRIAR